MVTKGMGRTYFHMSNTTSNKCWLRLQQSKENTQQSEALPVLTAGRHDHAQPLTLSNCLCSFTAGEAKQQQQVVVSVKKEKVEHTITQQIVSCVPTSYNSCALFACPIHSSVSK